MGSGIRPGLERVRAVLRAAGRPQHRYPAVIVAGTNGKGSTSATLTSILLRAGYNAALYTSPHLVDIRERWMIGGGKISPELLDESIRRMRLAAEKAGIVPTYFEALTLVAFLAFEAAAVDVAILEVGMGGRLDATNVVRPLAALISPIAFDHMEHLGSSIAKIAAEKAGVIHRGCVALTTNTHAAILRVIEARAKKFDAPLHLVQREVRSGAPRIEGGRLRFDLATPVAAYNLDSPLIGRHQVDNIALAVRGAEELEEHFDRIDHRAIEEGVARTHWRGRLEHHLIGAKSVWIDGAHNPHGIESLIAFASESIAKPRTLVFGMMRDKDVAATIRRLFPLFDRVIVTDPDPERAMRVDELAALASRSGFAVEAIAEPARAFDRALGEGPNEIVICGSLYLAGAAVAWVDRAQPAVR